MNNDRFEQIINKQFDRCKELLVTKGKEYTPDKDVFEVFNKAATLSGEGGRKAALFSFMLKHLVSISDMCHSEETFTMDRWNEKITDTMNYLLLLKAMVEEDEIFRNDPMWRATGYSSEELVEKLANTEIRLDQVFVKDNISEGILDLTHLVQEPTKRAYDFSKYKCDLDFPYCILGGPEKCPTCKHWVEKEPTLSIEEEIARAKELEDDLK